MFSIFTYVMSRVTHSEPGLPMVRVGVKNLKNIFSPSFVLRCCNSFRQRYKATNVFVFLQRSGILYWENKLDKEFLELKQQQCTSREPN